MKIKTNKLLFILFCLFLNSCNFTLDNKIQGKWEVIEGGNMWGAKITYLEFSNGIVYSHGSSFLTGDITKAMDYTIKDGKIFAGELIFELLDNNTLITTNYESFKMKLKKVHNN